MVAVGAVVLEEEVEEDFLVVGGGVKAEVRNVEILVASQVVVMESGKSL